MADHVGQQLGNYRLVKLLGRGGFAEVYLAEHTRLGMKAAIKLLHTHLSSDETSTFQREARTIAELKHAHIVRVLDYDVQESTPFLVLDYASNGSLRQKHPSGRRLPLDLVVDYVNQIAGALLYAHERKIIHRDVKPENILLDEEGRLLLSDFGIATIAHSTSSMSTEAAIGTLAYMAPEQIQGKPRPASDQYALAVMVYHWLTGLLPFSGSSAELIAQHLGATVPSLCTKLPELPEEVEQVVLTALSKDPQQRFGSVQAFARALAAAQVSPAAFTEEQTIQVSKQALEAPTRQANPAAVAPTRANARDPHLLPSLRRWPKHKGMLDPLLTGDA
ncbi:serine/threonine protein kinase [Ktedonosporobacter rubrisoli]|uniref:non-specific serine/threonine protein kinase n=1 Tax=Ktedonosporobacter rubrisoli TaxID=2509675 RepID=A0A4P6JKP4_KTERU|nr:serine/threonine-protein kinase [Ktedonosporobacter rubrisoli]QBD75226.1 serine/threonine protein kinase [Ktedonosporobacter rubrisoli]